MPTLIIFGLMSGIIYYHRKQLIQAAMVVGRAMFISYYPEVYCNFDNEIEVSISASSLDQVEKGNESKAWYQFQILN